MNSRTSELTPMPLADEAQRTMEYLRVRAEDDKILQQHGYGKRSSHECVEFLLYLGPNNVLETLEFRNSTSNKSIVQMFGEERALQPYKNHAKGCRVFSFWNIRNFALVPRSLVKLVK